MSKTKIKIEFISEGFREILCSGGVQSTVASAAAQVQSRANSYVDGETEGFALNTFMGNYGGGRWVSSVYTTDHETCVAQSENQALVRALSG